MTTILIIGTSILFIILASARFKIHPFISLMVATIFVGFACKISSDEIIKNIGEGFGSTLSNIGLIIAFGTIIGSFLEHTGATSLLASVMLKILGQKRSPLAMNITGLIVSIPVFCDSGFVILSSLLKELHKKTGITMVALAVALSTGLYASHVFVPPTPGPLAAASILDADLGLVMLIGLLIAIPSATVGMLWAKFAGKSNLTENIKLAPEPDKKEPVSQPNFYLSIAPIFIPVILIALRSIARYPTFPFGNGTFLSVINFIGHPLIALFLGLIPAFMLGKNKSSDTKFKWITSALKEAGVIILITGAGGSFGQVLKTTNVGEIIGQQLAGVPLGIFLPFIIAAIIKTAQGSSTVAIITTAAIIAPLQSTTGMDTQLSKSLVVLAIGAGAMTVSHINDSYFWVVSQFAGLNVKTALKSHTMATFIQGICAIMLIALIQNFIN